MDLLLATRNAHKTRELRQLLGPEFSVRDLIDQHGVPAIEENGSTFEENARIKALAICSAFPHELVIADDSGLEVDALGGAPGVLSARYAGEHARDAENVAKLLVELERVSGRGSPARFVCAIVAAKDGTVIFTAEGEIAGKVAGPPRGTNGFGYDPMFTPIGSDQTFAQLPAGVKNAISHRAAAARELCAFLRSRGEWS
jgi:XTP/dITP diphosphohydrolase